MMCAEMITFQTQSTGIFHQFRRASCEPAIFVRMFNARNAVQTQHSTEF